MTKYYKEVCVIGKKNIIILIEFISYHSLSRLGPYLMGHFYPLLVLLSLVFVTIEYQRISNLVHISSYYVRGNSSGVKKSNKRNIHVNMLTYFTLTIDDNKEEVSILKGRHELLEAIGHWSTCRWQCNFQILVTGVPEGNSKVCAEKGQQNIANFITSVYRCHYCVL